MCHSKMNSIMLTFLYRNMPSTYSKQAELYAFMDCILGLSVLYVSHVRHTNFLTYLVSSLIGRMNNMFDK